MQHLLTADQQQLLIRDLATRSQELRLMVHRGLTTTLPQHATRDAFDAYITHPYTRLRFSIADDMDMLGQSCQHTGTDARQSPRWHELESKDRYIEGYERFRLVQLHQLTPRALHDALSRRNRVQWNSWLAFVGPGSERDSDAGPDRWGPRVWLIAPSGDLARYVGITAQTISRMYARMTGSTYAGADVVPAESFA